MRKAIVIVLTPLSVGLLVTAPAQAAPLRIENYGSRLCLVVPNATETRGVQLRQDRCGDAKGRFWSLERQSNGTYQIVNGATGQCLAVEGGSTAAGADVIQFPCGTFQDRYWTRHSYAQGYQVRAKHSGQCPAVEGGSREVGAYIIQWPCGDWADHFWRFV